MAMNTEAPAPNPVLYLQMKARGRSGYGRVFGMRMRMRVKDERCSFCKLIAVLDFTSFPPLLPLYTRPGGWSALSIELNV